MYGLLQIIREIYHYSNSVDMQSQLIGSEEIKLEIEALFKALQINDLRQVGMSGALNASQTKNFKSLAQQIELSFLFRKSQILQSQYLQNKGQNGMEDGEENNGEDADMNRGN
jgi:hypothetical protein